MQFLKFVLTAWYLIRWCLPWYYVAHYKAESLHRVTKFWMWFGRPFHIKDSLV